LPAFVARASGKSKRKDIEMDASSITETRTYLAPINTEKGAVLAEIFRQKFPNLSRRLNGRLDAAVKILATGQIRHPDGFPDYVYQVPSQSNPLGSYQVDTQAHTCTCPDSGKGNLCKHRLAVGMWANSLDWYTEYQQQTLAAAAAQAKADELARYRSQVFELSQAENDAWHTATEAIDRWETAATTLRQDGTYPDDNELEDLRAVMICAVSHAQSASLMVQSVVNAHNAKIRAELAKS
jgi:hypothetical protein